MSLDNHPRTLSENRLLAALPPAHYQRLLPDLDVVTLAFKQAIYAPGHPITHVYFPLNGVISLVPPYTSRSVRTVVNPAPTAV